MNTRAWVNTHAWRLHSACNCLDQHDGCCSSCCLSKSKSKSESAKVIWNKIDSFFRTNCWRLTKRTGHYAWPRHSFSWSDCTCNHPSCCRTCSSSRPCCRVKGDRGIDHLNDKNSWIINHHGCVGYIDGSHDTYDCNVDCSLIHSYVQQEVKLFSFPLAACPWRSSQERQPTCRLLDTAQRRWSSWVGQ